MDQEIENSSTDCWLERIDDPKIELGGTKLVMEIEATITCPSRYATEEEDDEDYSDINRILAQDSNSYEGTLELNLLTENNSGTASTRFMREEISKKLFDLNVPFRDHESIADKILNDVFAVTRDPSCKADGKIFHMRAVIHVFGEELGDEDMEIEPYFVPASKSAMEKLEKAIVVQVSTMCSVCREDMMAGSEATRMPCLHLYHESCIVEWLGKSKYCPLCRYSMPSD
ncbi:putative aminoacyltransferase, E1 ubiquitin-activating enzyme [Rosa chinensis]|uniref:RING-type E3 ubiquitin transferase n=1 Tax=Rosa chinensis TaxID=74649 RepID=A0A2P6SCQ0_ROSCH|nr:E3 ubiquitin ligase BIG BROTHER-related [Rosa chinensis]PRQ56454.1 putative aminoacyltransferase, E1 ubiquitin-activating enzyme [Rosa chinensis]